MKTNLKTFFKRLYQKALFEEDILSTAAQVAFYFSFALFPLLLFLISLFGIILESANDFRGELFFYLRQIMPSAAFQLVQTTIQEVTENSSGGKLTLGLLIALWSASAGIDSLRIALNSVYNLEEKRSWIKTKILALAMTFFLTLLVTIACGIVFYGWKFLNLILNTINLSVSSPYILMTLQWITVLAVLLIIFGLIYNYLPMHEPHKWVWITPGSVTGIILWLAASYTFRLYLSYFNSYDKTYGSLGAMIILLLWLFLTAVVILIGGIINATLQEMTDPETAAQSEKQREIKLEKAKADRPAEEVEKMKQEHLETQKELEQLDDTDEDSTDSLVPVFTANQTKDEEKPKPTTAIEPKVKISAVKEPVLTVERNPEKTSKSAIVGLTAASAFGFLMGMMFRKNDKK